MIGGIKMREYRFAWDWGKSEPGNAGSMEVSDFLGIARNSVIDSYKENMDMVKEWKTEDPASWNLMIDEYKAWVETESFGVLVKVWAPSKEELKAIGWEKV